MPLVYGRDSGSRIFKRWQSAFNTAETAGAGKFVDLPCYRYSVGDRRDLVGDKVLGEGRDPEKKLLGLQRGGGEIEVPMRGQSFGYHLRSFFGPGTPSGSGTITHTFTSGGGMVHSTIGRGAGSNAYFADVGVTYNEMRLRLARAGEAQRVTFSVLSSREEKLGAVIDSAPVAISASEERKMAFDGVLKVGGVAAADIVDLDLTLSHQRTLDEEAASGDPWPLRVLEGDFLFSGSARFRFEDATRYDAARAATEMTLALEWTSGNEDFTLTLRNAIFAADRVPLDGGGVLTLALPIVSSKPVGGASATAVLVNTVADYGNPA